MAHLEGKRWVADKRVVLVSGRTVELHPSQCVHAWQTVKTFRGGGVEQHCAMCPAMCRRDSAKGSINYFTADVNDEDKGGEA